MGEISIDPKFNIHETYKKVRILNPYRNVSAAPTYTNNILYSYDLTNAWWDKVDINEISLSEFGIGGLANTATYINDPEGSGAYSQVRIHATVINGANPDEKVAISIWVKKDQNESRYPEFYCGGSGGNYVLIQMNTKTGATGYRGTAHGTHQVIDKGDWWAVNMLIPPPSGNTFTSNYINIRAAMADGNTAVGSSFTGLAWGSLIVGHCEARMSESYIDTPTITNG